MIALIAEMMPLKTALFVVGIPILLAVLILLPALGALNGESDDAPEGY